MEGGLMVVGRQYLKDRSQSKCSFYPLVADNLFTYLNLIVLIYEVVNINNYSSGLL